jgi:hypothetical protein
MANQAVRTYLTTLLEKQCTEPYDEQSLLPSKVWWHLFQDGVRVNQRQDHKRKQVHSESVTNGTNEGMSSIARLLSKTNTKWEDRMTVVP